MTNHFMEFTIPELIDAYAYFTFTSDYIGCRLVADAFIEKTSIEFKNLGL